MNFIEHHILATSRQLLSNTGRVTTSPAPDVREESTTRRTPRARLVAALVEAIGLRG